VFPKEICEANLPKPAKIKSFLIEKFLLPALIKIKIFAGFGGWRQPTLRKRWVGLPRWTSGQLKVSIGILFKIGSPIAETSFHYGIKILFKKTPQLEEIVKLRTLGIWINEYLGGE